MAEIRREKIHTDDVLCRDQWNVSDWLLPTSHQALSGVQSEQQPITDTTRIFVKQRHQCQFLDQTSDVARAWEAECVKAEAWQFRPATHARLVEWHVRSAVRIGGVGRVGDWEAMDLLRYFDDTHMITYTCVSHTHQLYRSCASFNRSTKRSTGSELPSIASTCERTR